MTPDNESLLERAIQVRDSAYAPYSKYLVGAAVADENGDVHLGCNVENTAFPQGSCAEANAIGAMIAAGGTRIDRIAVAGGTRALEVCTPCGGCRQRILEFSNEATRVLTRDPSGRVVVHSMAELLPDSIKPV